jgi:hypothetical protein
MAHFAKLDENNVVLDINAVSNDVLDFDNEEQSGITFLTQWSNGYSKWKQTSYNASFRKKYAAIGDFYDAINDVFISPQPFPSWTLNQNFDWQAPKPMPNEGFWYWDEELGEWINAETL